jgi:hypothetical protein
MKIYIISHTYQMVDHTIATFNNHKEAMDYVVDHVDDCYRAPHPDESIESYLSEFDDYRREEYEADEWDTIVETIEINLEVV